MNFVIVSVVVLCVVVCVCAAPAPTVTERDEGSLSLHLVERPKRDAIAGRSKQCREDHYPHPASGECKLCNEFLDIFTEEQMCGDQDYAKACGAVVEENCSEDK